METLELIIVFGTSFATTFLIAPIFIEKLAEKGFVTKDFYKSDFPSIPTMGGLIILSGVLGSLIAAQLFSNNPADKLLIFYFIVFTYAVFGLVDDLIDISRREKIILPFFLSLPIALLNIDTTLWVGFTQIELGVLYTYILAPIYVMVVANLVNMNAGYNGLSSGLSLILFISVAIGAFVRNGAESLLYVLPILGSTAAFFYFNKYPSKVFEGNCGNLMLGSALGGLIVLNNMEIFGVVILIPHIINFLMYVVWKIKKIGEIKFGKVREDGTLEVPNPFTMKWLFPYYFKLTEPQSTFIMYLLTMVFGSIGFMLVR